MHGVLVWTLIVDYNEPYKFINQLSSSVILVPPETIRKLGRFPEIIMESKGLRMF